MEPSDDELIMMIRAKNEEAINMLLFRYQKYSITLISNMYHKLKYLNLSFEELRAQLDLTIIQAAKSYDPQRAIFYSYWRQIAERELISLCRKSYYKKNQMRRNLLSLDSPIKETEDCYFIDTMADEGEDVVEYLNQKERLNMVKEMIDKTLTTLEKTILAYKVQGYSYKEIARIIKKSPKDIDNALMLARKKLQKVNRDN